MLRRALGYALGQRKYLSKQSHLFITNYKTAEVCVYVVEIVFKSKAFGDIALSNRNLCHRPFGGRLRAFIVTETMQLTFSEWNFARDVFV